MSPLTSHPDLDLIRNSKIKQELLHSNMFWGTAGSVFAIHDEPDKFGSINYLHPIPGTHGKHWFGFTKKDSFKIKAYLKNRFPYMFVTFCENYLRHSQLFFNPEMLQKLGITYYHGTQQPGDFVLTFPGSLHMGYNMGTNLAEVSFGNQPPLTFGRR